MIIGHVIPHEEAFVRALNGEEVYGCISDLDTVWYVNLKTRKLFDVFNEKLHSCDYTYCLDWIRRFDDGDKCSIPAGTYNLIDSEDYVIEIKTVREFREALKWC